MEQHDFALTLKDRRLFIEQPFFRRVGRERQIIPFEIGIQYQLLRRTFLWLHATFDSLIDRCGITCVLKDQHFHFVEPRFTFGPGQRSE